MLRAFVFLASILLAAVARADEPTSVKLGGEVYGAQGDELGPIGGGSGYTRRVTRGDFLAKDLDTLLDALAKAKPGQVVFIPAEAEIDCTARVYIEKLVLEVPAGVTLAGDRGQNGSRGALISSDALATPVLIRAKGPDVRVTGLRIQGPCPNRYLDHHARAFSKGGGGHAYYYKFPTSDGIVTEFPGLEVDNCEVSAFAHGGVCLRRGDRHHVHHNFIHHCQYNGLGYGISHGVSSSLIERNLFDFNRHSIASTGSPGCSYEARHNVELGTSLSHCFDMHGGRDRNDGTNIAGTTILIHHNTMRASTRAVAIRGVPQEVCRIEKNWFVTHAAAEAAVRGEEKTIVQDNAYGAKPVKK